jgi:3-hydroxybutyryl-CoA dehydratase
VSGRTIDELAVGEAAERSRAVRQEDVDAFLALVGDSNPIHSDPAALAGTRFDGPIAPGMLTAALISAVIGSDLPGPGVLYASQELRFLRPVRVGDVVTARVEVVELLPERNRVRLRTTCRNQGGEEVLTGEAWVLPRRRP